MTGHVLFVHGTAERYGADRSMLVLATGLRRRGWRVTVALGTDGPLRGDLVAVGAEVFVTGAGHFRRVFSVGAWLRYLAIDVPLSAVRIARLARRADVVHLNTSALVGGLVGAMLSRRPLVVHLRESYGRHRRQWAIYGRLVGRSARAIVANSSEIAREAVAIGFADRTVVVHNGLDFGPRPAAAPTGSAVVMAGRINEWKGQPVLVDATALLRDRGIDIEVEIAGDVFPGAERYRDDLVAQIERLGLSDRVTLLGFVDPIERLLERAAIFVLPSVKPEPFGLALIEAMAFGLACVATDAGGPREIIRSGENGLLVPPGDAGALADAIDALCRDSDLRHRLGTEAAGDVRRRFGADRAVAAVAAVYERVTQRQSVIGAPGTLPPPI